MFQKLYHNGWHVFLTVGLLIVFGFTFHQSQVLSAGFTTNLTGWSEAGGTWTNTAAGRQGTSTNGGDIFTVASESGQDFTYEADVAITGDGSPGAAGALIFRSNSDGSQCYAVNVSTENDGLVKLFRFPYVPIMVYQTPIRLNNTYHLKVVARGSSIQVYLNHGSTPVISVNDSAYTSGHFGLNIWNGAAVFQNVMKY